MDVESYLPIVTIIFFVGLLVGYIWGRKEGKQEGFSLGFTYAPLEMRRQVLLKGICLICGHKIGDEEPGKTGFGTD